MTNWMLNSQKGSYDWNHNKEYEKCPYCGSNNTSGSFHMGVWEKKYECGSTISANWSNDGYTVKFGIKCPTKEGTYNNKKVIGRVLA